VPARVLVGHDVALDEGDQDATFAGLEAHRSAAAKAVDLDRDRGGHEDVGSGG
jgi:hypothetical protein